MYNPKAFQIEDPNVAVEFMRRHNFATVISVLDGELQAGHVPFIVEERTSELPTLYAHFARANPQWQTFDGAHEALVIFRGPHGYVSPSLYDVHPAVPTWNYQVVHAYGMPRLIEGEAATRDHVFALVKQHEAAQPQPWQPDLPDDYTAGMLRQIVAFRIDITRIEAKFKLSQNRSATDRENVTAAFETSNDAATRGLGHAMRATPRLPDQRPAK